MFHDRRPEPDSNTARLTTNNDSFLKPPTESDTLKDADAPRTWESVAPF